MTQDEIIRFAIQCRLVTTGNRDGLYMDALIEFANLVAAKALAQPEQEPVALPCCGYADASAVKWNLHNQVVQCHNCGQVYTHPPQSEQKPVAWKLPDKNVVFWEDTKEVDEYHGFKPTIPLYPHPQRKPLTDEEIDHIYTGIRAVHHEIDSYVFARAIEAKLKEKNT